MLRQLKLFDDLFAKTSTDKTDQIFFGDSRVEIQRRPYQRSLNVLVRPNGNLKVTVGRTVSKNVIQNFLLKNSRWIEKNLGHFEEVRRKYPPKSYIDGEKFLFKGQVRELKFSPSLGGRSHIEEIGNVLLIRSPRGQVCDLRSLVRRFYERGGRQVLKESVDHFSKEMGLAPSKLMFRSAKSQWGSCSTAGHISLNWRLVVFPEELWNYVVVHELAHLRHPNHSAAFWSLVEEHCPNYKTYRRYLSDHHYEVDFLAKKSDLYVEQ